MKNLTVKMIIDTLCSKEFEGRLVGSKGNDKARDYIGKIFKEIELDTLIEDTYYHEYYEQVPNFSKSDKKNELKLVNNVVGVIKGENTHDAVIISAHFDHIGYKNGKLIPGALDNASGVASLIQIAQNLKEKSKIKPFDMDIIFCAFNSEEIGRRGSRNFVNDIQGMYYNIYNINIDCVGGKQAGKLALKSISKISDKLYDSMKACMTKNKISFSDTRVKRSVSDYKSFEEKSIPNINIEQEYIKNFIHKPTDTPDIIDCKQIEQISNAICDFIQNNNGKVF